MIRGDEETRMPDGEVVAKVIAFLQDFVGLYVSDPDFDLFAAGRIDSMQILDVVTFVETQFKVIIPESKLTVEELCTPARIGALVESLRAA